MKNQHLIEVLETVKKRDADQPEFIQAVTEVFESHGAQDLLVKDELAMLDWEVVGVRLEPDASVPPVQPEYGEIVGMRFEPISE